MLANLFGNLKNQIATRLNMPARQGKWEDGIKDEMQFWDGYLRTRGGKYPSDFAMRLDPDLSMQPDVENAIGNLSDHTILEVLDVGAGPLTYLGKQWPRCRIAITAVDPLAATYDELLAKHGITPLVRTRPGDAESLVEQFGTNRFDLVHARNSIDHSYNPLLAIEQMVEVARPGGIIFMHHSIYEAKKQRYAGFHQWNLSASGGELIVSNLTQRTNVSHHLAPVAAVTTQIFDRVWMINIIRKR